MEVEIKKSGGICKKWWSRIILGILVVFGILYWLGIVGFWSDNLTNYFEERQDARYFESIEKKSAELERLYKEDTYGGETPEETWGLFVEALEKGDTDLASKYFVVEKQEEAKEGFRVTREKGAISLFLDDFSKINSGVYYKDDNTRFQFVTIGTEGKWKGVVEFTYDLVLNQKTNKWKILEL